MHDCKECMQFFVQCPCCKIAFCPSCGKVEGDDDEEDDDEEDDANATDQ